MLKVKEGKVQRSVKKTIISFVTIWIIGGIVLTFFAINEINLIG